MSVKIYTTSSCGACKQAKALFKSSGVKFTEYNVEKSAKRRDELINKYKSTGVPVIVINGSVVIGFNRGRILELLAE
jgi:glutaredoxin 3